MTAIATTDYAFVAHMPETIRTDRLTLRAPNRSDVASMVRLSNNLNIYKWLSRLPNPYREADAIAFIDEIARGPEEYAYSILTHDGGFIGVASLMHLHRGIGRTRLLDRRALLGARLCNRGHRRLARRCRHGRV